MTEGPNGAFTRYPEPVPLPAGPFAPDPAPQYAPAPMPESFEAGDTWKGHWNFKPGGVDAEGYIPMPSQPKIDKFQRAMAKLFIDLEVAERAEREARAKAETKDTPDARTADEMMAEVNEALKLKAEVFDKFATALSDVCSKSPNKTQLKGLNEIDLKRFINHVGRLLNPEV